MTISYKHFRIEYNNLENSKFLHLVQYYRKLLRANSVNLPSFVPFRSLISYSSLNKNAFKSRYLARLIGRFIYSVLRFKRISLHILKLIKNIRKAKRLKKYISIKIYNRKNELIFLKKIKHFIFFFKWKCRRKIRKQRYFLWKRFYQIPHTFFNNSKKKRIKSFIWRFFNRKGKYGMKNIKKKNHIFFLNFNRISNLIYKILSKKRFSRKKWLILKKKYKKKNKITIKITNNAWLKAYINNTSLKINEKCTKYVIYNEIFSNSLNSIIDYFNPNFKVLFNELNNKSFYSFFINYCYYQYFRLLYKNEKWKSNKYNLVNSFYKFISNLCKNKIKLELIRTSLLKKVVKFSIISHNILFVRLNGWFNVFSVDRNINLYFIINNNLPILSTNKTLYIENKNTLFSFYYNNMNKFSKNSIFYINFQKNILKQILFKNSKSLNKIKKNENINEHISYFKNINKNKLWTRTCFHPYILNSKKAVQFNLKNHPSNKVLKIKNIFNNRNIFFFKVLKNKIKNNFIYLSTKNKNKEKINYKISNQIKQRAFRYKQNKYRHIKNIIKFSNLSGKLLNDLLQKDQFLLNYFLYTFIKKKHKWKSRNNYYKNTAKPLYFKKKNKLNYFITKLPYYKYKECYFNEINYWKYYKICSSIKNIKSIFSIKYCSNNCLFNYKYIFFKKYINAYKLDNYQINKPSKLLNIFISNNSYSYYLKYERNFFLEQLWKNRQFSNIIELYNKKLKKQIKYYELKSRFYNKLKFINKTYSLSYIEKELIFEYYLKLHSNKMHDEFERNFSKIGPLSFYHSKTINIGYIEQGSNVISDLLFFSKYNYPKILFSLTSNVNNMLIMTFFSPLIKLYTIDNVGQFIFNNKNNYFYYKNYLLNKI